MEWLIAGYAILFIVVFFYYRNNKKLISSQEAELLKRKEFFEILMNSIPDPVFVKNREHQWIYGNAAFSKIVGIDLDKYLGKSDYDIFPQMMSDVFWKKDNETLDQLKVTENEELIIMDGKVRTILTKKTPVTINEETILVGVIRDITERKQHEETIRELYGLIESSSDLYCICDLAGQPSFMNQHCRALGYSSTISHYKNFFSSLLNTKEIESRLMENKSWAGEVMLIDLVTGLHIPYWIRIFYILNEKGNPKSISVVGTNIRERKEAEIRLLVTAKMASMGEMAGSIAHEINNPLAIISGKSEQIKKYLKEGNLDLPKLLTSIEKIEETAFRIAKIIQGLKSFSRSEDQDPLKEVLVHKVIDETLKLCRERLRIDNITLLLDVDQSLLLKCRPIQIQQVLMSLLNNSIDAIKEQQAKWIKIETSYDAAHVYITVIDSGNGIPPYLQNKIMTPFFTTKAIGKATGLGLSISKGIMESHQGTLRYNINSDHTSFSLVFNT